VPKREKDIQNMSEHQCAHSYPVRPRGVEERGEKGTGEH